ncbi:MAG TPA: hypothetical protein VF980_20170 [Thermoanaerobaculia bacterium]
MFDGRIRRPRSSSRGRWLAVLLLVVAAAAGAWFYRDRIPIAALHRELPRTDSGPIRVVRQRPGGAARAPGAKLSEPEAVITLRRYLANRPDRAMKSECVAIASRGFSSGEYAFVVIDSCKQVRLGRWRVDGRTGEVRH